MDDAAEMFWILREQKREVSTYDDDEEEKLEPLQLKRFSSFTPTADGARVVCDTRNHAVLFIMLSY